MEKDNLFGIYKIAWDILIIIIFLCAVIGLWKVVFVLQEEGSKCVKDPLNYYMNLGEDKCWCQCLSGRKTNMNITDILVEDSIEAGEGLGYSSTFDLDEESINKYFD